MEVEGRSRVRCRLTIAVVALLLGVSTPAGAATGQLYAFGDNYYGQLGSATSDATDNPNPTPAPVTFPDATGPVTQIAVGSGHSLVVTSTGQLFAFGYNTNGQLASTTNNGTENANPTPALVVLPGASGPVTEVAAGDRHSLALTSTGQLYAFGDNDEGQLGNTTNNDTGTANPTPALVSLPGASGPVTQIAAGHDFSLALTSTGQLFAFGGNDYGQLGSTANNDTGTANPTPALVSLPGPVTQIAAGAGHTLVLTSTEQLYAFGLNNEGQLGITTNSGTNNANPTPTPVPMSADMRVAAISRGPDADHTLVWVVPSSSPPAVLLGLRLSAYKVSLAGRRVKGRCVRPRAENRHDQHCRLPIKLKLSYTLTTKATVTFTIKRQAPGRKLKGRCVKPTSQNHNHPHCERLAAVAGHISQAGVAGANILTFNGKIGGHKLGPGTYQLTAHPRRRPSA